MKRIRMIVLLLLILSVSAVSPEDSDSPAVFQGDYTLIPLTEGEAVLGLSPDGSRIAACTYDGGTGRIRMYDTVRFSMTGETELPEKGMIPIEKKAVWSPDGRYAAFRSSGVSPSELRYFKSSCMYAVDMNEGKLIQISDDRYKGKISFTDVNLYFDPSFSYDSEYVLYHRYQSTGVSVAAVRIKDKKEESVIFDPDRGNTYYTFPLGGTKILINKDPMDKNLPNELYVTDWRKKGKPLAVKKSAPVEASLFQVCDMSADRRKILLRTWWIDKALDQEASDFSLIVFADDFAACTIKPVEVPEGQFAVTGNLRPDGKQLILVTRDRAASESRVRTSRIIQVDLATGARAILLEDGSETFIPGGQFLKAGAGLCEGMFVSDTNMLVHCEDGFRLYNIK